MALKHQTQKNDLSFHLYEVINFQGDKMHDDIDESTTDNENKLFNK